MPRGPALLILLVAWPAAAAFPLPTDGEAVASAVAWFEARARPDGCVAAAPTGSCSHGSTRNAALALSAAGVDPSTWPPGRTPLVTYLRDHAQDVHQEPTGCPACTWAKTTVVVAAVGEEPRTFGGVDAVRELDGYYDGLQVGSPGQINDDVWALYAWRAAGEPASAAKVQNTLQFVRARQNVDGGWAWDLRPISGAWTTASALLALRAWGTDAQDLALQRGLDFLRTQQGEDGLVEEDESPSAESTAVAVQAVVRMGEDPTGPDWTTNRNLVDAILTLRQGDGSFAHNAGGGSGFLATTQVLPALRGVPYPYRPPHVVAASNVAQTTPGATVSLTCEATDPDGRIAELGWRFEDGTRAPGARIERSFNASGTHQVECRAVDDDRVERRAAVEILVESSDVSPPGPSQEGSPAPAAGLPDAVAPPASGARASALAGSLALLAGLGAVACVRGRSGF